MRSIGNPQNMLIGSLSGVSHVTFLATQGTVALARLALNWLVVHRVSLRGAVDRVLVEAGLATARRRALPGIPTGHASPWVASLPSTARSRGGATSSATRAAELAAASVQGTVALERVELPIREGTTGGAAVTASGSVPQR